MLLIFYLLIVFKIVESVKMKSRRSDIDRKVFQKFGRIIRERRRKEGLTQEELADLAGIHRTYVAGIESGYRNPSLKNITRIAKSLGIKVKELFNEF